MNFTSISNLYKTLPAFILLSIICSRWCYAQKKADVKKDIDSDISANAGHREIGRMNLQLPPIKGHSTGEGITVANSDVNLAPPVKRWEGHWNAGLFRLPDNGRIVLRAEVKGGSPYFRLQAYGGTDLPEPDSVKFENNLYEAVWLRKTSEVQTLSMLWLTLASKGDAEASAKILELSVWQPQVKNKLDADKILETPPVHRAELKLHNHAMTMFLDGKPISGQMWSAMPNHHVSDSYLKDVLNRLDYPIAAIPFAVGENRLTQLFPSTWLGPDEYDWSYIDTHARRVLKARPDMKLVLQLALDGAVWWNDANPEAANFVVDAVPKGYNGNDQPAAYVLWNGADTFTKWLTLKFGGTFRLPSEAEWEYACRAGSQSLFSWGDELSGKHCNSADNTAPDGYTVTAPVGKFLPNAFGLYDMTGNVYEWCADWYEADAYRYRSSPPADPKGAATGTKRVVRGGSWRSTAQFCRSAFRLGIAPTYNDFNIGFRVVMLPPSGTAPGKELDIPAWANVSQAQVEAAKKLGIPVANELDFGKGVSMKFVLIPPGEFMMGSGVSAEALAKRFANTKAADFNAEFPQHRVEITQPFYMAIHETANAQYREFTEDSKQRSSAVPKGVPDYLSPLWRRDMRELLRQLVAHVQTSDWGQAVIGYELFNGASMDCNFVVPHGNPRVIADFRSMLTKKYPSDAALQQAWSDPAVTLDSALPWTGAFPPGLILEPATNQRFIDTKELIAHQFRMVFSDVAAILKEATHRRAIVGARTGDFFGNSMGWDVNWFCMEDSGWLPPLLADPNFDFFDVQEPYIGRQLGGGSGVPIIPPHALQQYGKTVVIQNDVRTHLSEPNVGYGRTPDLESTIQLQRRVLANSLTYNMNPYLFQMEYGYNQPELLAEYRKQEMILRAATTRDRSSVAETAIVFDPEMRLYLGADTKQTEPTRHFGIFDFTRHVWQRAGAPFDMIFLDQIESLPPYRVYVFCNTWRYTPEQMRTIRKKVLTNGQCAVFLWADGVISDEGTFSAEAMSVLTGMKIAMSRESLSWKMRATVGFPGVADGTEVGTLAKGNYERYTPNAADWEYEPSFRIESGEETVPLAHRADGSIAAAMRREADYTVIYSASGNLTPPIFRLALERARAFRYTDSSALLMMNRSYLAFHTDKDETIKLQLPTAQRLVNLFSGEELPTNTVFGIPVRRNHTYVFGRQ